MTSTEWRQAKALAWAGIQMAVIVIGLFVIAYYVRQFCVMIAGL